MFVVVRVVSVGVVVVVRVVSVGVVVVVRGSNWGFPSSTFLSKIRVGTPTSGKTGGSFLRGKKTQRSDIGLETR